MRKKILLILCVLLSAPLGTYATERVSGADEANVIEQQKKEVTGTIFDETGAPVAGATIIVKNST